MGTSSLRSKRATNEPYNIANIADIKLFESYNRQYSTDFLRRDTDQPLRARATIILRDLVMSFPARSGGFTKLNDTQRRRW